MGDLQIGELFQDRCFITVLATGLPATLLADITTVFIDELGNRAAGVVTEQSNGWYTSPFTPDAAGTWATEWSKTANPENYVFHYPYKEFKVGGGEVTDIKTETVDILGHVTTTDGHVTADYTATEKAAIDLLDDAVGGLLDVHTDVADIHTDVGTAITASGTAAAYAIVNSGLGFRGIVTAAVAGVSFTIGTLAGLGAGIFADATSPWYAYVLRDASSGTGGAPQGEYRKVLTYVTATGLFTTDAFSVAVAVTDDVIITSNILSTIRDLHDTDIPDIHTDVGTVITNLATVDGLVDTIKARTEHHEITKTFFSPCQIEVVADTSHTDANLPTVTLPNIAGTITHVYAGFKFRMIENTNAAVNKLSGAQEIQVDTVDAINFVDDQFGLAATTREGGDCIIGLVDLVATVDVFNHGYAFVWDEPLTDQDAIHFNDVQTFLIVSYY